MEIVAARSGLASVASWPLIISRLGGCAATEKLRKFQTEFLFYLTPFDAHEAKEGGRGREKARGVWLVPRPHRHCISRMP